MNKPAEINWSRTWLRLSGLLLGIVVLVWLPVEESSQLGVVVISGLICTWGAIWMLRKTVSPAKNTILHYVLIGAGAGLLVAPLAILLMAIKSGIHGHGTPEFTVLQMQSVLTRTLFYFFGGVLLGAGSGFLRYVKEDQSR